MTEEEMETLAVGWQVSNKTGGFFTIQTIDKSRVKGSDYRCSTSMEAYLATLLPIGDTDMFKDYLFTCTNDEGLIFKYTQSTMLLNTITVKAVVSKHDKKALKKNKSNNKKLSKL